MGRVKQMRADGIYCKKSINVWNTTIYSVPQAIVTEDCLDMLITNRILNKKVV